MKTTLTLCKTTPVTHLSSYQMVKVPGIYMPAGSSHKGSRVVVVKQGLVLYLDTDGRVEVFEPDVWTHVDFIATSNPITLTFEN